MASTLKDESSDDDLYGDIDDMYVSQSETESVHKSEGSLTPTKQNQQATLKTDEINQKDTGSVICDTENDDNMNDLDLYDDLIAEEDLQKVNSFQEMMKKFEEAMILIQQLESENKSLRESLNKQETTSKDIQRNFSSLLITAKGEINRKEKELNTLRKQLTGNQRTPGRYRNSRETLTETSSITSIDSDFNPLYVSSPGRLKLQRSEEKSSKKYDKDTERCSSNRGDSFDRDRKNNDRRDEERDRRKGSKSSYKDKSRRSEHYIDETEKQGKKRTASDGNKHRKDYTESSNRYSENESDVSSTVKCYRKIDQKLNLNIQKRSTEDKKEARDIKLKFDSDIQMGHDKDRDKRRDGFIIDKRDKNEDDKRNVNNNKARDVREDDENSGIRNLGIKPKVLDLRDKLRQKRLSGKQKEDSERTDSNVHISFTSLSKSSEKKKDSLPVKILSDSDTKSSYSVSEVSEKVCKKPQMKKRKENLNAEKEFLEQLKMSIKKNELASGKTKAVTQLEQRKIIEINVRKESKINREIISYSDASNEVSDIENSQDTDRTIESEKYFTASEVSNHISTCETPMMSEVNETLQEEICCVFSENDMESESIDKDSFQLMNKQERIMNDVGKDIEMDEGSNNIDESLVPVDNHNRKSPTVISENPGKYEERKITEHRENTSQCDHAKNSNIEPMEVQTINNFAVLTNDNVQSEDGKISVSLTDSNFDKKFEQIDSSVNVSPDFSNSSKKEETPGSARRRSARLLSKSENSLNNSKSNNSNVSITEEANNKDQEGIVKTQAEMTSAEKNKGNCLQRSCSNPARRKRVRRCVTSETISCVTSVSDSDIFNSKSDDTGDLIMSTDEGENSEDTCSSENSGKLQNLVCTDKNCTIKMRHLHPKCSNETSKSPEFCKETLTKSEREPNKIIIYKEQDKTHDIETDNKEKNTGTVWNAHEILNSLDVDSELENIHANNKSNVNSGTIEVTAVESVDDSESSSSSTSGSNYTSSDSGSSSGCSDSESESSDDKKRKSKTKSDTVTQNKSSDELINNPVSVTTKENVTFTNNPVKSLHLDRNNINDIERNSYGENRTDLKEGDMACDELKLSEDNGLSFTGLDNAIQNKQDTNNNRGHNFECVIGSEDMDEIVQKKNEDDLSSIDNLKVLNDGVENCVKSAGRSRETMDSSLKNNNHVGENCCDVNKESDKQNITNNQCPLKEKTVTSNPLNLSCEAMECNDGDQIKTEKSGTEENTELKELENDKVKETNGHKAEGSENESEGSFGSNIMSEKTDSLQSGDESEFSDSDDSNCIYSGESECSSSDESGTGSSWETCSSDAEEDEINEIATQTNIRDQSERKQKNDTVKDIEKNEVNTGSYQGNEDILKTDETPMEIEEYRSIQALKTTEIENVFVLNNKTPLCKDKEMEAGDEKEIEQGPNNSKKLNNGTLRLPEINKSANSVAGISPDRSHMLQCLLDCVQEEFKNNASLNDRLIMEKQKVESNNSEISKDKVGSSRSTAYNEIVDNNIDSCQVQSSRTENENSENKSLSESTGKNKAMSTEVIVKEQNFEKKDNVIKDDSNESKEKMMIGNKIEDNICDADLSESSVSDSEDSSSGSTHPTDCSTCSSYSGSSSETESDEEIRQEDKIDKGVTDIYSSVNCESNDVGKENSLKSLQVQKTGSNNVIGNRDISKKADENVKDVEVRNVKVNKNETDKFKTALSVMPCNTPNPYFIADELPEFLQPKDSVEISDGDSSKGHDKNKSKASPGIEISRPKTPAVKFANLSPRSKEPKIDNLSEVREVKKITPIGVIPSVVQGKNEADKTESSKSLKMSKKPDPKHSEENSPFTKVSGNTKSKCNLETDKSLATTEKKKTSGKTKTKLKVKSNKLNFDKVKPSESQKSSNTASESVTRSTCNTAKKKEMVSEKQGENETNGIFKGHNNQDKTFNRKHSMNKNIGHKEKEIINQPLRRSPRKKPSQLSVADTRLCDPEEKSHFPVKASASVSPKKGKSNNRWNSNKTDNKNTIDKKNIEKNKLVNAQEKGKRIDRDETKSSKHSMLTQHKRVHKERESKDTKREEKENNRNEIDVLKENPEHRSNEGRMELAEHTDVTDPIKDRKREKSGSQQLSKGKESSVAKIHFRDTTRELSEKIMKLKVEQNILKKELAEKQRKEDNSLKLKLAIPRVNDSKSRKDTKENVKSKAPLLNSHKTGKTQPLKVAMAANGHEEIRSRACTFKTGSLNKNENLTFEEKLGSLEGILNKSDTISKLTKRNTVDPSLSLTVQNASLKTFTIPKLLNVKKRKKDMVKSKNEPSTSQIRSIYCSKRNIHVENKPNHSKLVKRDGLKPDHCKNSKPQNKPNKRFLSSDSESSFSDSGSDSDEDSSNSEGSGAIVRAMFGSSDSSGNSKKSITLADLCKTRSSEDTDDIVKNTAPDLALNNQEYNEINKSESSKTVSCKEKDVLTGYAENLKREEEQTKKVVEKKWHADETIGYKNAKESSTFQSVHSNVSNSVDNLRKGSDEKLEFVKSNITGNEKERLKALNEINIHTKGKDKEYFNIRDCENDSNKSRHKANDKLNTKSGQGQKSDDLGKKTISHEGDKEKKRNKDNVIPRNSEITLRKSPRTKARSPVKIHTTSEDYEDSRVELTVKDSRSNRTPSKTEKNKCVNNSEVRYFELSDKNPILNKIVSPKKPKHPPHAEGGDKHCYKTNGKSKEIKKLIDEETEKESKGVPILLLEENTMDGIDYHDDVTLDIGSGNHFSDNENDENDGDDESSENSVTDLSGEEGELSDSDEALECSSKPIKKALEVTPKKQKMTFDSSTRCKSKISPVRFLSNSNSVSSCKCSKKDCIHTRLALSVHNRHKRHKSDSDSASDSSMSRQKRRPGHYPRPRSRSRENSDKKHIQNREKYSRKSPVRSQRRSPPRRRGRSRSRSTSPFRERRKRSRSHSPRKLFKKGKESTVSRYRNESGKDSPRFHRRYRSGSREFPENSNRYGNRRKSQSCRDYDSENTLDFQRKRSEVKRHNLEKGFEEKLSKKCRDSGRDCSENNFDKISEDERFSKLRFEKTSDTDKGKQFTESRSEKKRDRVRERRSFQSNLKKGRQRSRSFSRSPNRNHRKKRLRSDSESEVSDRVDVKNKKGVSDKHKDSYSPSHKRSKPGRNEVDH